MTRINSAINVELLTDEHLLAEHREIKRLPGLYKQRMISGKRFNDIPTEFTLGKGHVLFFINKCNYTFNRYLSIHNECIKRGFDVEDYSKNWDIYHDRNDAEANEYIPTNKEYHLLLDRIIDRLLNTKKSYWHYYGERISKEDAVKIIELK